MSYPIRCRKGPEDGLIEVFDGNGEIVIARPSRLGLDRKGLKSRFDRLEREYHLAHVPAQLSEWAHRDQLSLPCALHQNNVSALFLDREGAIDPTLLARARHVPAGFFGVIKAKRERRGRKALRNRRKRESQKARL